MGFIMYKNNKNSLIEWNRAGSNRIPGFEFKLRSSEIRSSASLSCQSQESMQVDRQAKRSGLTFKIVSEDLQDDLSKFLHENLTKSEKTIANC
jgi:hypothetical protein